MKRAIGLLLISFAVFSLGYMTGRETAPVPPAQVGPDTSLLPDRVDVYYFHVSKRCDACMTIERETENAVKKYYAAELASGKMRFLILNYDLPENKHFVGKYSIPFNTVVLSKVRGGQEVDFYDLGAPIWKLTGEPDQLCEYIHEQIAWFMDDGTPDPEEVIDNPDAPEETSEPVAEEPDPTARRVSASASSTVIVAPKAEGE